jgi:hypothetical protein
MIHVCSSRELKAGLAHVMVIRDASWLERDLRLLPEARIDIPGSLPWFVGTLGSPIRGVGIVSNSYSGSNGKVSLLCVTEERRKQVSDVKRDPAAGSARSSVCGCFSISSAMPPLPAFPLVAPERHLATVSRDLPGRSGQCSLTLHANTFRGYLSSDGGRLSASPANDPKEQH